MKGIVSEMYSIDEIAKILSLDVPAIRAIQRRLKVPYKKYMCIKYFNVEDFIPYKYNRIQPAHKRKYDLTWVQSLDETTPDIYYGISEKEEVEINIRQLFGAKI